MRKIGEVEKKIYSLRSEHPLVIPQFDPGRVDSVGATKIFKKIQAMGLDHIAVGGTIIDPTKLQEITDIATKDFNFSIVTYPTNNSVFFLKGVKDKTAIYWMSVFNSENPFYSRDVLIMNSLTTQNNALEPIPTAYVFDDRGDLKSANWMARAIPVPRDKPDISLSIGLAAEFLGIRFYILAGGSGTKSLPPRSHVSVLSKKTNLFLIPTSGIINQNQAKIMFTNNADAIHVGRLMEMEKGFTKLERMVNISKKFPGKDFL
jgi:phosphoglycerol geranylgeranyltransferase